MINNRFLITGVTFVALGLMGLFFAFVGTSLPSMRSFFKINIKDAGLMTATVQLGFALTCFLGGILSDIFSKDKVLMIGSFFLALGGFFLGINNIFYFNLFILGVMGIGSGLILSGSNALVVELFPQKRGAILNLLHIFFAIGSFLGPLFMGYIISLKYSWQNGYRALGGVALFIFLFFIFTRIAKRSQDLKIKVSEIRGLIKEKDFLFLILINFLSIGIQFAIMFMIVTFLKEARGFSIASSSIVLSSFFILLAIGRLISSAVALKVSNSKILMFLLFFLSILLVIGWMTKGFCSGIIFAFTGLACSGIFPSLLALISLFFSEMTGTVMGILAMCGGLGGMTITYLTALISQHLGLNVGFILILSLSIFTFFFFMINYKDFLEKELHHQFLKG
ncbi:MAG: MFS transporter [Deltaproteobacteria bacterium]|nr:MFS transporter [Deltaproteobacteria bacterium]